MKIPSPSRLAGFTLVELMVVIAITAILATLAGPAFSTLIENQRIRSASSNLYTSIATARSEAIKRNTSITLAPIGGDWAAGWQIAHPTISGTYLEQHPAVTNITITGPASIVYSGSGRVQAGSSITINLSGTTAANTRCVYVDLSGRPAVKSC